MTTDKPYDVVLSFAGEDRKHAEALADALKRQGITVFYDNYGKVDLWGEDLYTHLSDVYQRQGHYCVMFLSKHYAKKVWTAHERQAAQARALEECEGYILPLRLDDTEIPGILPTIGYIAWSSETPESIAGIIFEKLQRGQRFSSPEQFYPRDVEQYQRETFEGKLQSIERVERIHQSAEKKKMQVEKERHDLREYRERLKLSGDFTDAEREKVENKLVELIERYRRITNEEIRLSNEEMEKTYGPSWREHLTNR